MPGSGAAVISAFPTPGLTAMLYNARSREAGIDEDKGIRRRAGRCSEQAVSG